MRQLKIQKTITNRESFSLEKYLQEIGKEVMVNADEEAILTKKIREGDKVALDKLVKANLRFVVSVAKQYQNQGLTLSDLINEGNIGLIKAAQKFDETRGFKFISYAVWWIRQSVLQALAEQSRIIRLPLNQVGNISKVNRAYSKLEQEFEREPTPDEIGDLLELSVDKVYDTIRVSGRSVSMDAPFVQGEENALVDVLENEDSPSADNILMTESLRDEIDRSLSTLTDKECQIVKLFYGLGMPCSCTLDEIGLKLNLTKERVRQIKEKALRRLRHKSRSNLLKAYLG
jgi:RNA polymerase primary sigma factor